MKTNRFSLLISILAFTLLLSSCAVNPVTGKRQLMFISESREIRMGEEYDPQITAAFGLYENEVLQELIEEKGKEMGKISHRPNLEYHFRILDSPVINAFAVPGGYIYFTRGILAQFNNEAEMIGVLGHEMGHITARHTASRQTKQTLGQLLLIGGMIASEEFRQYGELAMVGMQILFLSFSRADEREADMLGVEYASKIGYDAAQMADFYRVLMRMNLQSEHGGIPTWLSTHPDPGDRYEDVRRDAEIWKDSLNIEEWTVNTERYLNLIDGMVYGEDPRQGFVEDNVFYHPDLEFMFPFPLGWNLENSPLQVRMTPDEGDALMIFAFAKGNTLDEAANNTLNQLEVNVTDSRKTTVNGMPAIRVHAIQESEDQQNNLKMLSYFIDYEEKYYVFLGVSKEEDFDRFAGRFETSMTSFNRLTDPSKLNVEPERLKIIEVEHDITLIEAFRAYGVPADRREEMAFLNNMELTDQVYAGTLLKIVDVK